MEKPLNIRLHVISPVHIGCDDVYEPTNFVIDEKKESLIEFDPMDFIKSLSSKDRDEFSGICMEGSVSSIIKIYRFISNRPVKGREVELAKELNSHYKRVKDLPINNETKIRQELNRFEIKKTAFNNHDKLPYIPGSSLKGALRTAVLSGLAKEAGIKDWWGVSQARENDRAKELEGNLLKIRRGDFETDPFRLIKVSDLLPFGDVKTKIVYAINKKKKTSEFEARGPFQLMETIKEGAIFEGRINILQPQGGSMIRNPIGVEQLLKSANAFFIPAVNDERKITNDIGAGQVVVKRINEKFKGKIGQSAYLIRLGRHSGAEAVTIEGNRFIKINQGGGKPPKFLDHATTIWLASETSKPVSNTGLIPFGWAVLEVL